MGCNVNNSEVVKENVYLNFLKVDIFFESNFRKSSETFTQCIKTFKDRKLHTSKYSIYNKEKQKCQADTIFAQFHVLVLKSLQKCQVYLTSCIRAQCV